MHIWFSNLLSGSAPRLVSFHIRTRANQNFNRYRHLLKIVLAVAKEFSEPYLRKPPFPVTAAWRNKSKAFPCELFSSHHQEERAKKFPKCLRSRLRRSPRSTGNFSVCEAVTNKHLRVRLIDTVAWTWAFNGIDPLEMGGIYLYWVHNTSYTCTQTKVRKAVLAFVN